MRSKVLVVLFFSLALLLESCMVSTTNHLSFADTKLASDQNQTQMVKVNVPMWIAKPVAKRALKKEPDGQALALLLDKVKDVKVYTVANSDPQFINSYKQGLRNRNYEDWMTIKKDTEVVQFQAQQNGSTIHRLLVTVASNNELVLIDVSGKFSPEDISSMINYSKSNDLTKKMKQNSREF